MAGMHELCKCPAVASAEKQNTPTIYLNESLCRSHLLPLWNSFPTVLPLQSLPSQLQSFPSALWITAPDPTKMEINQSFQESDLGPILTARSYSIRRWWPGSCREHFHLVDLLQFCGARQHFLHDGYFFFLSPAIIHKCIRGSFFSSPFSQKLITVSTSNGLSRTNM